MKKKIRKLLDKTSCRVQLVLLIIILILNLLSWSSSLISDFYVDYIFPVWVNLYGRLTGLVPFSVGELMIIMLLTVIVLSVLLAVPSICLKRRPFGCVMRRVYVYLLRMILPVCLIMTLNCTMLYHCSKLEVPSETTKDYGKEDVLWLYNMLMERANELSLLVERDENDVPVYEGNLKKNAIRYMKAISDTYERLDGFYPITKDIANSWFLSQQYIAGYYFPFSLESNINRLMHIMNKPYTICHELAHIRGYIYEDEANFLAFVACYESGDLFFEYSGCIQVLPYVSESLMEYVDAGQISKKDVVKAGKYVLADSVFLDEKAWDKVNEESLLNTDTVSKYTQIAMDTSLKLNGVGNGVESYNDVLKLLLAYFL